MNARLSITEPTGRSFDTEIDRSRTYTIGRAKENDIVLNDRRVSRKHAFIFPENGQLKIVDGYVEGGQLFRSVNHIFINGTMNLEHLLKEGDTVLIGESRIDFHLVKTTTPFVPHVSVPPTENLIFPQEDRPKTVNFDDAPLGHTQVQISVNEFIGGKSNLSLETAVATPAEIKDLRRKAKILELLFEMGKTLGTVFELEEIFEKATDLIFRGTPADRVVALLAEEGSDGRVARPGRRVVV